MADKAEPKPSHAELEEGVLARGARNAPSATSI